jgi:hypothetical protein
MTKINSPKVSIPKPCNYGWDKMTLTGDLKGRHCAACDKIVVDFTIMSTDELKRFLHENRGAKTCGYFKTLNTTAPKWYQKPLLNLHNRIEIGFPKNRVRIGLLLLISGMIYLSGCSTRTAGDMEPVPRDMNDTL